MSKSYSELKAYHRQQRDNWGIGVNVRVHRALSWLDRAEQELQRNDSDAAFIFLWLSFNAAYANEYEGVTWNSGWNRQQLRDAVGLLSELMPLIIELMTQHGTEVWGDVSYYLGE